MPPTTYYFTPPCWAWHLCPSAAANCKERTNAHLSETLKGQATGFRSIIALARQHVTAGGPAEERCLLSALGCWTFEFSQKKSWIFESGWSISTARNLIQLSYAQFMSDQIFCCRHILDSKLCQKRAMYVWTAGIGWWFPSSCKDRFVWFDPLGCRPLLVIVRGTHASCWYIANILSWSIHSEKKEEELKRLRPEQEKAASLCFQSSRSWGKEKKSRADHS